MRAYLDEGMMLCLDKDNKDDFDVDIKTALITVLNDFYLYTPKNRTLRAPWVGTIFSTMVMGRKVSVLRHISTSIITMDR